MNRWCQWRASCRSAAGWLGLGGWFFAVSLPVASLHLRHWVSLPSTDPSIAAVTLEPSDHWRLIHYLAPDCGCSLNLADHLIDRQVASNVTETIWLSVDDADLRDRLRSAGFPCRIVTAEAAGLLGVPGGPWLLVVDPSGTVRYSGGHSKRINGAIRSYAELSLLDRLANGQSVAALPSWGCSIDPGWQATTDPFGLKY